MAQCPSCKDKTEEWWSYCPWCGYRQALGAPTEFVCTNHYGIDGHCLQCGDRLPDDMDHQ